MDQGTQFTNTVEPQAETKTTRCQFCKARVRDGKRVVREVVGVDETTGAKKVEFYTETEPCCTGKMLKENEGGSPKFPGRKNPHRTTGRNAKIKFIPTAPGIRGTGRASRSPQLAKTRKVRIAMAATSRRVNRGA